MKALVIKGGKISLQDYPVPQPGPREVLIKNYYSAVSTGTESATLKAGTGGVVSRVLRNPELMQKFVHKLRTEGVKPAVRKAVEKLGLKGDAVPLGYSSAGVIVSVGRDVMDLSSGMRVAAGGVGYAGHAEYVRVPRNLVARVPDGVSLRESAFSTVGAVAIHGLRQAELRGGEWAVIYGLGLLGLIAVQVARAWGVKCIGVDIDENKLKIARELGCGEVFTPGEHLPEEVKRITGGFGADASVIYASTPSSEPLNMSLKLLRQRGRVVVVGDVGMDASRALMYEGEHEIRIARSYGPGRYDHVYEEMSIDYPIGYVRWTENRNMEHFLELVRSGAVRVEPLITGVFPFSEAEKALEEVKSGGHIGVLIEYDREKEEKRHFIEVRRPHPAEGKLKIAFVGPGEFARAVHLPNLKKLSDAFYLKYLVGRNPVKTGEVAKRFGFEKASTSLEDALSDPDVDMVFIATRHSTHAELVLASLSAGKDVFVEKPLCVTREELERIKKALDESGKRLIVGFNRRYSPFARSVKKFVEFAHQPVHVLYRVNAGYLPPDHWVHLPEEGGRLIGEGCHFFNFFLFITSSRHKRVTASAIPPDGALYVEPDSFSVTADMEDGSVCTLVYTSRGGQGLPKEYVEVASEGVTFVIDDYRELKIYGQLKKLPEGIRPFRLNHQDKGLVEELSQMSKFFKGKENELITHDEIINSMELTFSAREAIASYLRPGDEK